MSQILWKSLMLPDLKASATDLASPFYNLTIQNVRPYPILTNEIEIPDAKSFRSMTRASVMLSHLCFKAKEAMSPFLSQSPFSVGIYCAVENGPIDAESTQKILDQMRDQKAPHRFAEYYKKYRNPKMYLKQLPNLAPAQMGISLGLQGPMNVYTHATEASLHALEQAEWDLKDKRVDAALVCSAHAFDDHLVLIRSQKNDPRTLTEGAAAVLLAPNETFVDWVAKEQSDSENFFGIADQLVNILRN